MSDNVNLSKYVGGYGYRLPYIMVNGYGPLSELEIIEVSLRSYGFLPEIYLKMQTNDAKFLSKYFPKKGDLINIFVRGNNYFHKPIRNDYIINSIHISESFDKEAQLSIITMSGTLWHEGLYREENYIFKDKTSYEVLFDVSTRLDLGFASNIEPTSKFNDKQDWINDYRKNYLFLKDVILHSYKDENSFFEGWIDFYYNLNFVDVNLMLKEIDKVKNRYGLLSLYSFDPFKNDKDGEFYVEKEKIYLSNLTAFAGHNFYFYRYKIFENVDINKPDYVKISWFNILKNEIEGAVVFPILSKTDDKYKYNIGLVMSDTYSFDRNMTYKFKGKLYPKPDYNVHPKWYYAEEFNNLNNEVLNRKYIDVYIQNLNLNLYKGMMIPVQFWKTGEYDDVKAGMKEETIKNLNNKEIGYIDESLTDIYYVRGIEFKWDTFRELYGEKFDSDEEMYFGKWTQIVSLTKREWVDLKNVVYV